MPDAPVIRIHNTGNRGPSKPVTLADGSTFVPSSFGIENTTINARKLHGSERVRNLEFREQYYNCTQHDLKGHDFWGRVVPKGSMAMQPLLSQGAAPSYYVPLNQRRPCNPYNIGPKIVSSFTSMLFGHGRWPQMRSIDSETQDYAEELVKSSGMVDEFTKARNIGGSCGTVGVSWKFDNRGALRFEVHKGQHVHVHEYEDFDRGIPRHVSVLYQYEEDGHDPKTGKPVKLFFWHRRDWTTVSEVEFLPAPVTDEEPEWVIDNENSVEHEFGKCRFVFIRNKPDTGDITSEDGLPDYHGQYLQMENLDLVNSVVNKGGISNLDPTLMLNIEPDLAQGAVIQKGSDNALLLGMNGKAAYLEISGAALTAGLGMVKECKQQILETTNCILIDPNEAAASATSSVALKVIYMPMTAETDVLRTPYGRAIQIIINDVLEFVRMYEPDSPDQAIVEEVPVEGTDENIDVTVPVTEQEIQFYVAVSPKVVEEDELDETGQPTGNKIKRLQERVPGSGTVTIEWGEYFPPTADDKQKTIQSVQAAAGAKPVVSQRTAVELVANLLNRDPNQEWIQVMADNERDAKSKAASEEEMFPPIGGQVTGRGGEDASASDFDDIEDRESDEDVSVQV